MINKDITTAFDIIDKSEFGTLSMVDTDGFPYSVPLSMVRIDEDIFFHTAMHGEKTTNIIENNNVCVNFVTNTNRVEEHYTTDFESLIVKGKAVEIMDDELKIKVLRIICEKYASSNMAMFEKVIEKSLKVTAIWKIHMDDFSCKIKKVKM